MLAAIAVSMRPRQWVKNLFVFAGLVFALVVLWSATELAAGRAASWLVRPWYRRKAAPSFADVLATLRHAGTVEVHAPLSLKKAYAQRLQRAAQRTA